MINLCKVYLLTGNCPYRDSCTRDHPEPSETIISKPPPKKMGLKLGKEFISKSQAVLGEEKKESQTKAGEVTKQIQDSKKEGENSQSINTAGATKRGKLKLGNKNFEIGEKAGKQDLEEFLASQEQKEYEEEEPYELEEGDGYEEEYDDESDEEEGVNPHGAFWDYGGKLVSMDRDPEFFCEASQNCSCCKGHIYNCEGEICQNLDACYCYEFE